jgi:anti-anti-sigma factor
MSTETPVAIEVELQDNLCVVRLKGRFVAGTDRGYVLAKLDEIKVRACTKVLVDLEAVSSIGSMGIGFLVGLYTTVTKNPEGRFMLTGANSRVCDVLRLTRLDGVIPQAADFSAGLAALRG